MIPSAEIEQTATFGIPSIVYKYRYQRERKSRLFFSLRRDSLQEENRKSPVLFQVSSGKSQYRVDICEANRKEIIIIKTNSGFRIDDLHDDLGISIRESRRRTRAGRSSRFPEARKFYLAGRMRRRDTIALPRRTLFFSFTSAISLSRVLLARSGMGN